MIRHYKSFKGLKEDRKKTCPHFRLKIDAKILKKNQDVNILTGNWSESSIEIHVQTETVQHSEVR